MVNSRFWVSNIPAQRGREIFPGVFMHVLRKDRPTSVGELSAYYAHVEHGAYPHLPHRHMDQELVLVHRGAIDLVEDQQTTRLGAGALVYTGPMCSHSLRGASEEGAALFVVKWSGRAEAAPSSAAMVIDCDWETRSRTGSLGRQEIAAIDVGGGQRMVVALAHCAAGARIPPHRHTHEVIELVLEGELPGLGYRASAPCISYFPAGSVHGMSRDCESGCLLLGLEIHAAPVREQA